MQIVEWYDEQCASSARESAPTWSPSDGFMATAPLIRAVALGFVAVVLRRRRRRRTCDSCPRLLGGGGLSAMDNGVNTLIQRQFPAATIWRVFG